MTSTNVFSIFNNSFVVVVVFALLLCAAAAPCDVDETEALNRYFYAVANDRPDSMRDADLACIAEMRTLKVRFRLPEWSRVGGKNMDKVGISSDLVWLLENRERKLKIKDKEIAQLAAFHLLCAAFPSLRAEWVRIAKPYLKNGFEGELKVWLESVFKLSRKARGCKRRPGDWQDLTNEFFGINHKAQLTDNPLMAKAFEFWPAQPDLMSEPVPDNLPPPLAPKKKTLA